jgi:SAM-dependent methyltransferase
VNPAVDPADHPAANAALDAADDAFRRRLGTAYGAAAHTWATGAAVVYDALAEALVDELAGELAACDEQPVLDLCAGTGAASAAMVRRGWAVVAADLSLEMLRVDRARRPPAVAADAGSLPFRAGGFAAVVIAFGVNHATDPVAFLAAAQRATRPGGTVATSTFMGGWAHPAKAAVDDVLASFGYASPEWHRRLKDDVEPATASPTALARVAEQAGLGSVHVRVVEVALDISAEAVVGWRCAMASHAGFVESLPPVSQRRATELAVAEVRRRWQPLVVPILVMSARA